MIKGVRGSGTAGSALLMWGGGSADWSIWLGGGGDQQGDEVIVGVGSAGVES